MGIIIQLITGLATGAWWLIQKFFPFLIKKFGLGAIKFAIQKAASVAVVLATLAFYASLILFISETYTMFKSVIDTFSNPLQGMSGASSTQFSCFLYLLDVSGLKSGFNSAFSFFISVMMFFFTRGLYSLTIKSLKTISDEISKSTKLI